MVQRCLSMLLTELGGADRATPLLVNIVGMSSLLSYLLLETDINQVSSRLSESLGKVLDASRVLVLPYKTTIVLYDV